MINEILQWAVLGYIAYNNAKLKDVSKIIKKNIQLINYKLNNF